MTDEPTLLSAEEYRPVPRTRLTRMAFRAGAAIVLVAGCAGVLLESPPAVLLFTPPAGFLLGLLAHAQTAKQENLKRQPKVNAFIFAVLALMIFMGYVPMVWKQTGWSDSVRISLAATNVLVQVLLFVAFFRQPYQRIGQEDGGGKG